MDNRRYDDRDENEIEIDVMELLYVFKKKAWIIILAVIAGCMAAGLYSVMILNPVYTSTSMVYVLSKAVPVEAAEEMGGVFVK